MPFVTFVPFTGTFQIGVVCAICVIFVFLYFVFFESFVSAHFEVCRRVLQTNVRVSGFSRSVSVVSYYYARHALLRVMMYASPLCVPECSAVKKCLRMFAS